MDAYNKIINQVWKKKKRKKKLSYNHVNWNKLDKYVNVSFQNDKLLEGIASSNKEENVSSKLSCELSSLKPTSTTWPAKFASGCPPIVSSIIVNTVKTMASASIHKSDYLVFIHNQSKWYIS